MGPIYKICSRCRRMRITSSATTEQQTCECGSKSLPYCVADIEQEWEEMRVEIERLRKSLTHRTDSGEAVKLDELCWFIEDRWRGTLATYRGFVRPRMSPRDIAGRVVEVFFVPAGIEEQISHETRRHCKELGREVTIICHGIDISNGYYYQDVCAIKDARR